MTEQDFRHLDLIQEAVLILNGARQIVFGNRASILRFGPHQSGQDIVQLIRNPFCLELINAALKSPEAVQKTISFGAPVDGTFDVKASRFTGPNRAESLLLVSLRDINEILLAEAMRSDFVANVSHELRSPLSSISGFIETLKGAASDDAAARARFLDLMEREAERMTRLIADLLSLSKVETNQRLRPQGTVDIVRLTRQVLASLEKQAEDRGKSLELNVLSPVPSLPGHEDELIQVLHNLLENALKYSRTGTVVTVNISVQAGIAGLPKEAVALQVLDRGEGIAAQHLPRLTERFYRVDSHRSRRDGGTGLGLAIVKHIVQRHRGRLKIESEIGKGSSFTVYLPL